MSNKYNVAELLAYKDELIGLLQKQIELFNKMDNFNLVPQHDTNHPILIDDKNIHEMHHVLQGEINKLENFDVVLAVVGTMKAGKSTTINAIVGKEIMPNRNRPMTAVPTLIRHTKGQIEPKILLKNHAINEFIQQIKKALPNDIQSAYPNLEKEMMQLCIDIKKNNFSLPKQAEGVENIFHLLSQFNDLVRLPESLNLQTSLKFPFVAYKEVTDLPAIEVEFSTLKHLENNAGRLMLLDTPGPNEAKQPHLRDMMTQQLKRCSAIALILDYTQLGSDAEEDVRQQLSEIPMIEAHNTYVFVNKFDQKNTNSDDADTTKINVFNRVFVNDLKGRVNSENIYPISAHKAYLANRMKLHIQQYGDYPKYNTNNWTKDFGEVAFSTLAEDFWGLDNIQKAIAKLSQSSLIDAPLENVITHAYTNAPNLAINSALSNIGHIVKDVGNAFKIADLFTEEIQLTEAQLQTIEQTVSSLNAHKKGLDVKVKKLKDDINSDTAALQKNLDEEFDALNEQTINIVNKSINQLLLDVTKGKNSSNQAYRSYSSISSLFKILNINDKSIIEAIRERKEQRQKITASKAMAADTGVDSKQGIVTLTDEQFNQFKNQLTQEFNDISTNIDKEAINLAAGHDEALQHSIHNLQKEINNDINNIQNTFSSLGCNNLDFSFPHHIEIAKQNKSFSLNHHKWSNSKHKTKKEEQAGLWGWLKRKADVFDNGWGSDNVKYTIHEINTKLLVESLSGEIENNSITPIKDAFDYRTKRQDGHVVQFITYVDSNLSQIIGQLEYELNREQSSQQNTANELKALKNDKITISKINKDIQDALEMLRKAFISDTVTI